MSVLHDQKGHVHRSTRPFPQHIRRRYDWYLSLLDARQRLDDFAHDLPRGQLAAARLAVAAMLRPPFATRGAQVAAMKQRLMAGAMDPASF